MMERKLIMGKEKKVLLVMCNVISDNNYCNCNYLIIYINDIESFEKPLKSSKLSKKDSEKISDTFNSRRVEVFEENMDYSKSSIDNSGGYMTICPEFSNKTISTKSHIKHEIVYKKEKMAVDKAAQLVRHNILTDNDNYCNYNYINLLIRKGGVI